MKTSLFMLIASAVPALSSVRHTVPAAPSGRDGLNISSPSAANQIPDRVDAFWDAILLKCLAEQGKTGTGEDVDVPLMQACVKGKIDEKLLSCSGEKPHSDSVQRDDATEKLGAAIFGVLRECAWGQNKVSMEACLRGRAHEALRQKLCSGNKSSDAICQVNYATCQNLYQFTEGFQVYEAGMEHCLPEPSTYNSTEDDGPRTSGRFEVCAAIVGHWKVDAIRERMKSCLEQPTSPWHAIMQTEACAQHGGDTKLCLIEMNLCANALVLKPESVNIGSMMECLKNREQPQRPTVEAMCKAFDPKHQWRCPRAYRHCDTVLRGHTAWATKHTRRKPLDWKALKTCLARRTKERLCAEVNLYEKYCDDGYSECEKDQGYAEGITMDWDAMRACLRPPPLQVIGVSWFKGNETDFPHRYSACATVQRYPKRKINWDVLKACIEANEDPLEGLVSTAACQRYHGDVSACEVETMICSNALTSRLRLVNTEGIKRCLQEPDKPQRPTAETLCRGFQDSYGSSKPENTPGGRRDWNAIKNCLQGKAQDSAPSAACPKYHGDLAACQLERSICAKTLGIKAKCGAFTAPVSECLRKPATALKRPTAEELCRGPQDNYPRCKGAYNGCVQASNGTSTTKTPTGETPTWEIIKTKFCAPKGEEKVCPGNVSGEVCESIVSHCITKLKGKKNLNEQNVDPDAMKMCITGMAQGDNMEYHRASKHVALYRRARARSRE
ncbi:hypothetical protein O9K51_04343 [Purpureocillium lavendulum]|uniref:Uncharacterized protein n=1 Tax=Purpureocillium lavendulum TaxID=1247861 RepID=A0AB34FWA5_9HYPO|nr:hypothetical protein O9K51_04343 [Purpureocillium lavendulum]